MTHRPLDGRVVVQHPEPVERTQGGVLLTGAAKEQPELAVVVTVAPGEAEQVVRPGDRVITNKYAGTAVKLDGKVLTILKLSDIIAIVND